MISESEIKFIEKRLNQQPVQSGVSRTVFKALRKLNKRIIIMKVNHVKTSFKIVDI